MKQFYLLLLTCFTSILANSQVTVTATAGTGGPTTYSTLALAFTAINNGVHQGILTINIAGTVTETSTAQLNSSGNGSASYSSAIIKPTGSATITGSVTAALVELNGADNVIIDGLNALGNSLTISNTSTSNTAITIRFVNDAKFNQVQNTTILGSTTGASLATIFFADGSASGNSRNKIAFCNILDAGGNSPTNAIYSLGTNTAGQENANDTIANNNIANYYNTDLATSGVTLNAGNTDWSVNDNKFYQTAARSFTTGNIHRIISINSGTNYKITRNTIGFSSPNLTGIYSFVGTVTTRFIGIDLASGSTGTSTVAGNMIQNITMATSSNVSSSTGIWCGINISSGNVVVGTTPGNIIGSSNNGSITVNPTVAGTLVVGILSTSTGTVTISDNQVAGIDLLPSGVFSGNLTGIQTTGVAATITVTRNIIGANNANSMRVGTLGTTTGNGIIRGILNSSNGAITISDNEITNLTHNSNNALALFRGIEFQQGSGIISGNSLNNISAAGTSVSVLTQEGAGILITSTGTGIQVTKNLLSNLSVSNSTTATGIVLSGIYVGGTTNGISITANRIYGFANASTSTSTSAPGVTCGIYCRDANAANPMLIANNMITFGNAQNTNTAIIGIWSQLSTAQNYLAKIYFNSVNIEGTVATGAQPSFCYYRGDFAASIGVPTVDLKNNIFTNSRTGGTGKHYAIANGYGSATSNSSGWGVNASNYNVLNSNASTIGYWSGDQNFTGWKSASAGDVNSLSGIPVNYNYSPSDLNLVVNSNSAVDGKAIPIAGITTDYGGQIRSTTAPDLGCDEFTPGPVPILVEYFKAAKQGGSNILNWKASCTSTSVKFEIQHGKDGRQFDLINSFSATQARCSQPFDFKHDRPVEGNNYYRLKMTELDGQVTYSAIALVMNKSTGFQVLGLMPNFITAKKSTLNISSVSAAQCAITITDMSAKTVLYTTVFVSNGSNNIPLNLGTLKSGTYTMGVSLLNENKSLRFVIID